MKYQHNQAGPRSLRMTFVVLCAMCVAGVNAAMAETLPPLPVDPSGDRSVLTGCNTTILTGGASSGNERAPNSNFLAGRSHYLITAGEMAASGFLNGASPENITWSYSVGNTAATGSLKIYMENTSDTTNLKSATWSTAIAGMTLVSNNASQSLPTTAGAATFPFVGGSPFTYTGGGLYVAFDWVWAGPVTSTSAVIDCNVALANGLKGAQAATPPTTLTSSNFRPSTRLTPSISLANEVSVDYLRAYGVVPTPLIGPLGVTAVVTNKGTNAQSNVPVSLEITGNDSFNSVQTVPALPACGGQAIATFNLWTPAMPIGSDTAKVSVPSDDNISNDILGKPIEETNNRYSYKHPGTTASGGAGFNGITGEFAAVFSIAQPAKVSQVEIEFFAASATTYKVAIFGDDRGAPSTTALYADAANRTVSAAGPVVITLPVPVSVGPGRFYVAVQQTNGTNLNLSYDREDPIRPSSFFLTNYVPPLGGWVEFGPAAVFRYNIGVKLIQCATAAECDDNNVCTEDSCVSEICAHSNNSAVCDDGNSCTASDFCSGGLCRPGANPCDDNDACTDDVCDGQGGCTYTPTVCNDNNGCTSDSCNSATGCVFAPLSGSPCSDGNGCTINDTCDNGICQPGPTPIPQQFCNSGAFTIPNGAPNTVIGPATPYPATIVASDVGTICKVTVQLNSFFHTDPEDVDVLLEGPQGQNAKIMSDCGFLSPAGNVPPPGINLNLDDASLSSMVLWPLTSGTYRPTDLDFVGAPESPWPAPAPVALGGSALSIFSGTSGAGTWNLWIRDQYAPGVGGVSSGWCLTISSASCAANAQCDDGNACNGVEACNGICHPGTPINCDDADSCTIDSCNPTNGTCSHAPNTCDDGDPCTEDSCTALGCVHTPFPQEVTGIDVGGPSKDTVSWNATPGAVAYDVVRLPLAGLPVGPGGGDETCFADAGGTSVTDASIPPPGTGFAYVVRASGACGDGTYGSATSGPRQTTTCD